MLKINNLKLPNGKSVDFKLSSGQLIVLVGASGVGKTLLLKTLSGLLPCTFDEFMFQENHYHELNWPKVRSEILYLQQKPVKLIGSVEDILKKPFSYEVNRGKQLNVEKLKSYLQKLKLTEDFLDKDSTHLSGGEEQMVAIIRTLLLDPKILLLDEPTAAIDRERTIQVENLILDWKQQSAKNPSIIFITHDEPQEKRLMDNSGLIVDFKQLERSRL